MSELIPGREYIRILPLIHSCNKFSYDYCSSILVFDGFNSDGFPIFHHPHRYESIFLQKSFLDGNWRPASIIYNGESTELTKCVGKEVKRILNSFTGGYTYLHEPVRLVSATKYHVVIINPMNMQSEIFDERFANPSDWELA